MKKSNDADAPQPSCPPNSGPGGRCFRQRRRSAIAACGPLGHGRHSAPAQAPKAAARRPRARPPPGRWVPGHPQAAGTEVGAGTLQETGVGKKKSRAARPPRHQAPLAARPPQRQGGNRTPGRKMLSQRKDWSRHHPPRLSLGKVSRLPFPRPTCSRHLV